MAVHVQLGGCSFGYRHQPSSVPTRHGGACAEEVSGPLIWLETGLVCML